MRGGYGRFSISSRLKLIQCTGEAHRRQRKAMVPAFGLTTSREYLPRFIEVIDKVSPSHKHPFRVYMESELARWNVERYLLERFR